ncbi:MAG: hypothetical protein E4H14_16575, partial [Candidatus Thorarchaeota archaeon]
MVNPIVQDQDHEVIPVSTRPVEDFVDSGVQNDVTVRFDRELTPDEITFYEKNGINFGDSPQNVGSIYIAKVSDAALQHLKNDPFFKCAEPLKTPMYQIPRDVSITETYTNLAWQMQDLEGYDLTGKGILIADLDTGINWRHPDFFFADGPTTKYLEIGITPADMWSFTNGSDGIDVNGNYSIEANETLYAIDQDMNGALTVDVDWLFLDNGTILGKPDKDDAFFVIDDVNSDSTLTGADNLIRLLTPKTKYIVHKPFGNLQVWDRDINITTCNSVDTDGHGTSVAGILNGGQKGYRKYVGIAPDAELMAINVFGSDGLTVEEGLIWARDHGADVILIELGSWTYEFLDGSSNVERMIDTLTAMGIPVIVPAGNLQGGFRHATSAITANVTLPTQFSVPAISATELYITVLSDTPVDNALVNITEPTSTGTIVHPITLGQGYWNFYTTYTTNVTFDAFIANSTKAGNYMIAIDISGWIKDTSLWSISIKTPQSGTLQFYISDDASAWSGGAKWNIPSDTYLITWPSTADTAISVASYMSRNLWMPGYGLIAPYSSIGPRIDGNPKMSVAAPGGWDVISAWSMDAPYPTWYAQGYSGYPLYSLYGGYQLFGGTSAAGPHVAAAAALMLQLNDNCGSIAKDIIEASAYKDTYTGALPSYPAIGSPMWGYGKLNVCAAIEKTSYIPYVHEVSLDPESPEYSDIVSVTLNITNANTVTFDWSYNNWTTGHYSTLTMSGGLYNTTIPAHQYSQQIWYRIDPVNSSAISNPTIFGTYVVGDTVAPTISSFVHNATSAATDSTSVEVIIQATEATNASGIFAVVIEFTVNNWVIVNYIPMTSNGTHYIGYIFPHPVPLQVQFRVVVYDNAGNAATTSQYTYAVVSTTTTATTSTTT